MKTDSLLRKVLVLLGASALVAASTGSLAQQYPDKPVHFVIPFAAGSSPDVALRIIQPLLSESLRQPIVVENKPGAAGNLGAAAVASARPDGLTFLYTVNSVLCSNPHLYTSLPFDALKSFDSVAMVGKLGYVLIAGPGVPYKTMADFISYAKANPGKVTYSSAGDGSGNHVVMEMLQRMAGIRLMHIPTKSNPLPELIGGHVDMTLNPYTTGITAAQSGKFTVLGVSLGERAAAIPAVPAIGETVKGFVGDGWHAIFAPANTPRAATSLVNAKINEALGKPDVRTKLESLGIIVTPTTPAQLASTLASDYEKWGKAIKDSNIKISN